MIYQKSVVLMIDFDIIPQSKVSTAEAPVTISNFHIIVLLKGWLWFMLSESIPPLLLLWFMTITFLFPLCNEWVRQPGPLNEIAQLFSVISISAHVPPLQKP